MTSKQPEEEAENKLPDEAKGLRIHQALARQLGIAIVTGQYQPGDGFGGEIEQAEAYKVSRTAYREAIRILIAKGLLDSRPKAGTHVTPRARWNMLDPDILAWMFSSKPDKRFVADLFELRGVIEPAAAMLAATRRTDAQVERMRSALGVMRQQGLGTVQGRDADQQFHSTILEAAGNEPLASLASSVGAAVTWTTRFKEQSGKLARDPIAEHLAVFDAIEASDPLLARATMEELLRLALNDMAQDDLLG
ncbi:FadR family transcriptional regulator [Sphingobium sufflavum]|uniref:FadR/GntR family transcriptional regulator n=1 Tax=Sphingobium sufflavum TaxID=1129547 RepID=UPI001F1BD039|nr:FadR/GntR family transcriptional regulator [Sphingobium sufflavum]MCE7796326.1 FadR family transcriptional regulator [Sphingobium sufflavum]